MTIEEYLSKEEKERLVNMSDQEVALFAQLLVERLYGKGPGSPKEEESSMEDQETLVNPSEELLTAEQSRITSRLAQYSLKSDLENAFSKEKLPEKIQEYENAKARIKTRLKDPKHQILATIYLQYAIETIDLLKARQKELEAGEGVLDAQFEALFRSRENKCTMEMARALFLQKTNEILDRAKNITEKVYNENYIPLEYQEYGPDEVSDGSLNEEHYLGLVYPASFESLASPKTPFPKEVVSGILMMCEFKSLITLSKILPNSYVLPHLFRSIVISEVPHKPRYRFYLPNGYHLGFSADSEAMVFSYTQSLPFFELLSRIQPYIRSVEVRFRLLGRFKNEVETFIQRTQFLHRVQLVSLEMTHLEEDLLGFDLSRKPRFFNSSIEDLYIQPVRPGGFDLKDALKLRTLILVDIEAGPEFKSHPIKINSPNLEILEIKYSSVPELENLIQDCTKLKMLSLEGVYLSKLNIPPLASLEALNLSETPITKLKNESTLRRLRALHLNNTKIQEFSFDWCPQLAYLFVKNCGLTQIDFVADIPELEVISGPGNQIGDYLCLQLLRHLKSCEFDEPIPEMVNLVQFTDSHCIGYQSYQRWSLGK